MAGLPLALTVFCGVTSMTPMNAQLWSMDRPLVLSGDLSVIVATWTNVAMLRYGRVRGSHVRTDGRTAAPVAPKPPLGCGLIPSGRQQRLNLASVQSRIVPRTLCRPAAGPSETRPRRRQDRGTDPRSVLVLSWSLARRAGVLRLRLRHRGAANGPLDEPSVRERPASATREPEPRRRGDRMPSTSRY